MNRIYIAFFAAIFAFIGMNGIYGADNDIKTRVITDHMGRNVKVPDTPQRIIALTRNFMEELFELGVTPIAKVEEYNNRPEGIALPGVSNQTNPDIEKIHSLKPDLIFANTRQHSPMKELLESTGASVVFIDPNKIETDPMTDRIRFIASVLNIDEKAQDYINQLDKQAALLAEKLKKSGLQTVILLEGGGESGKAAQPTGFYGMLLQKLGFTNLIPKGLPGSNASTWVPVNIEMIATSNPDFILLKASTNDKEEHKKLISLLLSNPAYKMTPAVKNKKVFVLPAKIAPGNITNADALKKTASILFPEGFKNN